MPVVARQLAFYYSPSIFFKRYNYNNNHMGIYRRFILPKFLNAAMSDAEIEVLRPSVISGAKGVVVEIGFGSGLNLPYYKNISTLYAVEPSQEIFDLAAERI